MKIHFPVDWELEHEIKAKGWLSQVKVVLDDGSIHCLTFYDPVRLAQDLQAEVHCGNAGLIEKGLLVIPEVTKENIEKAIEQAIKYGYFDR